MTQPQGVMGDLQHALNVKEHSVHLKTGGTTRQTWLLYLTEKDVLLHVLSSSLCFSSSISDHLDLCLSFFGEAGLSTRDGGGGG